MFRNGYGFDFSDYRKEFKSSLWKHLPAGLLLGVLGFYGYYLMSLAGNFVGIMLLTTPFSLIFLIPGTVLYLLSAYAAIEPGIEKRVVQPFEKSKPAENE